MRELGCAGTAAVITPVSAVRLEDGSKVRLPQPVGEATKRLYERLVGIQTGVLEDTRGWRRRIELAKA